MKENKIELSVVIIARNEEEKIKDCLESIKWADEIILVDNGSTDKKKNKYSSFAIPRRNIILGRVMKHGGWWPDHVKRLFRREKLNKWTGKLHEEPQFEGDMGYLKNALIHVKENNLSEMMEKTNRWSEIEANLMYKAGHPKMNAVRFASAMFREFWLRMIKNCGFLDGSEGIIFSLYQVWSKFISYAKLWEIQNSKK